MKAIWILTENSVSIFGNGKNTVVPSDHPNFDKIVKALQDEKDVDEVLKLVEIKEQLKNYSYEDVKLDVKEDGSITATYKDGEIALAPALQRRLCELIRLGKEQNGEILLDNFLKFINNLYQNPSFKSVNQLYGFLESNNLPITDDGCFLAYKKVAPNYYDIHSGKFDNSVGKTVSMARNQVEDDPNKTCSAGLHVCSYDYLGNYGSNYSDLDRVIIVKVNPKDVVSVPTDYNNAKMRVCEYKVIDELTSYFDERISEWIAHSHKDGWIAATYKKIFDFYKDFFKDEKLFSWDRLNLKKSASQAMLSDFYAKAVETFPEASDVWMELEEQAIVTPKAMFRILDEMDPDYEIE